MGAYSIPVVIGIDEEKIASEVQKNVEDRVVEYISNQIKEVMFYKNRSYYNAEQPLETMVKSYIEKAVDDNKDRIIELAAEKLADKLSRTKAVRERAAAVAKEVL